MTLFSRLALPAALLLSAAGAHAQSASDFQLPPGPTPTTTPDIQGPVDPDAPVPVRPRAIPSPRPTTTPAPRPTPSATALPTTTPRPQPTNRPRPAPVRTAPPSAQTPGAARTPTPAAIADSLDPATPVPVEPAPPATTTFNPGSIESTASIGDERATPIWVWILALLAAVAALAGFLWWKRREAAAPPPVIDAPPVGARENAAGSRMAEAKISFAVDRMSRSVRTATLTYRLTIANRTDAAIRDLAVECDLVGARNSLPLGEQLATEVTALAMREDIGRIGPNQTRHVTGQLQLALGEVEPIMRGQAAFFVPLARFRVAGANLPISHHTYVVGQTAEDGSGKLQPLELVAPPGGLDRIGSRAVT